MKIAFAESCTGGLAAALITENPGASQFFSGSAVVYSNTLKETLLRVSPLTLNREGAVSRQTALEMAQGLRGVTGADICLGVTGVAGPGGGSPDKPVGLVWFSWCSGELSQAWHREFSGSRKRIQRLSVMELFYTLLKGPPVDIS